MKLVVAVLLCLFLREASLSLDTVSAEEPTKTTEKATVFYGWLEKYQNLAPQNEGRITPQPRQSLGTTSDTTEREYASTSEPYPGNLPPVWKTRDETVAPGEGLGCYYHRSYYSHLPLFNDSSDFSLLGSLEVAEPYQKSLNGTSVSTEGE